MHILEHEAHDTLFTKGLLELNDILLVEHAKHLHLPNGGLLDSFVLLRFLELLDSHQFFGFGVAATQHHTIGTLSNHSKHLILLHGEYNYATDEIVEAVSVVTAGRLVAWVLWFGLGAQLERTLLLMDLTHLHTLAFHNPEDQVVEYLLGLEGVFCTGLVMFNLQ